MDTMTPGIVEEITHLKRQLEEYKTENARLRKSVLNQAGDLLCWLPNGIIDNQVPPWEEFGESCRRFHAQISSERGELTGCMTITQLEAENERLRNELTGTGGIAACMRLNAKLTADLQEALEALRPFAYTFEFDKQDSDYNSSQRAVDVLARLTMKVEQ